MGSYEPLDWAMHHAPMLLTERGKPDTTSRAVLAKLAWHAHADGTGTFPSVTEIRYATGYDDRTIERSLRRLESSGLIARDGVSRGGGARWKLALSVVRSAVDRELLTAEVNEKRRQDSAKRKARRLTAAGLVSGTESPGQNVDELGHVRDGESRQVPPCPGLKSPASGTQNPDKIGANPDKVGHVRDLTPPRTKRLNQETGTTGATLPPRPPCDNPPLRGGLTIQRPHLPKWSLIKPIWERNPPHAYALKMLSPSQSPARGPHEPP